MISVLYDDYEMPTREDWAEWMSDNGIDATNANDNHYWAWVAEQMRDEWELFLDDVKAYDERAKDTEILVEGILGLWDGKHEITPRIFPTLEKAISACCEDENKIEYDTEKQTLIVTAVHHDGTNHFTISAIEYAEEGTYIGDVKQVPLSLFEE